MYTNRDLLLAYEMGVKEASAKTELRRAQILARRPELAGNVEKMQKQVAGEGLSSVLSRDAIRPGKADLDAIFKAYVGPAAPSWYEKPGAAIMQEGLRQRLAPGAGKVRKAISDALMNPYVAHSILPAAVLAAGAAGYGAHQYFKNREDSEEKAASLYGSVYNQNDLLLAYEMGVKEASARTELRRAQILARRPELAGNVEKMRKQVAGEGLSSVLSADAIRPGKADLDAIFKAHVGPAAPSWYEAPGAAIMQEGLRQRLAPGAGKVRQAISDALMNPYVAHSILPAAVLAAGAAGYGAHQYFKNREHSEEKAASLYETVYNDFRNQNLREISAEWESLVQ